MRKSHRRWIGALGLFILLGGAIVVWGGRRPELGVSNGELKPCPASPNCVSSQSGDAVHRIEPLHWEGEPATAIQRLATLIGQMPRATILEQSDVYLRAEFRTRLMRFVDDVEFYAPREEPIVHVRSASRVGHSDLGVNRARIEGIRRSFEEQQGGK